MQSHYHCKECGETFMECACAINPLVPDLEAPAKMGTPETLRMAARELCGYVDKLNSSELYDGHDDHQTCNELDKAAAYVDKLEAQLKAISEALDAWDGHDSLPAYRQLAIKIHTIMAG